MVSLKTNLCGIELDNPLIPASGTFGFGYEFAEIYDINVLGSFSFKGTTKEPRFGNPTPRIAECKKGLINSVGLQNPGVHKVLENEIPKLKSCFHKPVMANVSGFSVEEYVYTVKMLDQEPQIGWFEVNVSCPNVHGGGMSFGTSPEAAAEVVRACKAVTNKPIIVKLSPNVTDIVAIAKACEAAGADGISLINTLLGMRIDLKSKKPVIANKMGGFSGPAIFPVAVRMVYQVSKAVKIPVVGMGGVSTAEDVLEMMYAGASLVMVGAQNLIDPYACKKIIEDLPRVMKEYNIDYIESYEIGTIIYVAYDNKFLGTIIIKDELKDNIKDVINKFHNNKIKTFMLSGDNYEVCNEVSKLVNINDFKSSLLPLEKVDELNAIIINKKEGSNVVFIGDGVNDAPSLVNADVGISMGGLGSDVAIESSDIVISDDSIERVDELIKISKTTNRIVKQNIIFSIGVKMIVMILTIFGLSTMLLGIFADVGVMIIAVLNALRVLSIKK